MRTNHIQHHSHKTNFNTIAAEVREDLFGDIEFSEFCAYAFIASMLSVMASVGLYMVAFYLI